MLNGLSGFAVERRDDKVVKWTRGAESSYILRKDCFKQLKELSANKMYPIKTVDILNFTEEDDYFEFETPYLAYETVFGLSKNQNIVFDQILNSLINRMESTRDGFKKICLDQLNKSIKLLEKKPYKDQGLFLAQKIGYLIDQSSDIYPWGYCHGDFGFANMLVDPKGQIYMIDFTHSFIYSPLMDIATLSMSGTFKGRGTDFTNKVVSDVLSNFKEYTHKIRVLKIVKMFSWLPYADKEVWREQLIKKIQDE